MPSSSVMKTTIILLLTSLSVSVRARLNVSPHPRLLFTGKDQERIERLAKSDKLLRDLMKHDEQAADKALRERLVEYRIPDGKRLLGESRRCIRTVATCAMAHRLTGDPRYADRAVKDMLAAAALKDWNPRHFLDTAEMTTALAIGYDWLFDRLTESQRRTIRGAIVAHGLTAGMHCYEKGGWWVNGNNNWNQVCNGGMVMGALAIAEDEPKLARAILDHAVTSIRRGMSAYEPDGAYPEGPGYWHYGTVYNVIMIDALRTALGDDRGIGKSEAFAKTGAFWIHSISPNDLFFNYADCHETYQPGPIPFKLATLYDEPFLSTWHRNQLARWLAAGKRIGNRFLALEIAWYDPPNAASAGHDLPRAACFHGMQDVAMMRSAWGNPNALYVGFKGGDNRTNHGHMDLGSFVLDADGQRWAVDLGGDDYNMPGYFGSKRWTYLRLNNRSHNTLTIADRLQNPKGRSLITHFDATPQRSEAVADLTDAYAGQVSQARRGIAMLDGRAVLVQDELVKPVGSVRWGMVTRADIDLAGHKAVLSQKGKTLRAEILEPKGATFDVVSLKPPTSREKQNEGTRMLAVTVNAGPTSKLRITVLLRPGSQADAVAEPKLTPLEKW